MIDITENDVLKYGLENGIIDMEYLQNKMEMQKREEILNQHPYKIWRSKDGKTWKTYVPDDDGRKQISRTSEKAIKDAIVKYYKSREENPTVKKVFYIWLNGRLENKEISKATYDRYEVDFKKFFSDFGKRKIANVTEVEIEDFLLHAIGQYGLTAKAFSNLRTLIFGIFKKAKKMHLVDFSISMVIKDMEISRKAFTKNIKEDYQEVFMENEEPKVMEYLKENQDVLNLGILLMFVTGMRVGELVTIPWDCVSGNIIKIRHTESRYKDNDGNTVFEVKSMPKSDAGIRDVVVPTDYVWILRKLRALNPFGEYMLMKDGRRVRTYTIRKRLQLVCRNTDVYQKSPHKIRKTYGSILLDNGVDKMLITQQMGHTDILCTEQHYHRNRRDQARKTEILSSIPELRAN